MTEVEAGWFGHVAGEEHPDLIRERIDGATGD